MMFSQTIKYISFPHVKAIRFKLRCLKEAQNSMTLLGNIIPGRDSHDYGRIPKNTEISLMVTINTPWHEISLMVTINTPWHEIF